MIRRSFALAIPTALLASGAAGCVEMGADASPPQMPVRENTASAALEAGPDVPPGRTVTVPSFDETAASWLLPATNPWAPYQKSTLLSVLDASEHVAELPDVMALAVVTQARRAATAVGAAGPPAGAMWVVDLRGAASVAFGAMLSVKSSESIAPVITFHNRPADNELIPAEETLAALATMRPQPLLENEAGQPVFLLDAWRLAYRSERPDDEVNDNRYMLTPADLPDAGVLLARGINRIFYVVESLEIAKEEEDDLHEVFAEYQAAGIAICMVDLDLLAGVEPGSLWDEQLCYQRPLYIDPNRVTIVSQPSFYFRARGGFGGPGILHGGGHGFGGRHAFGMGGHGGG
jgi:hypothetical protein